MTAALDAEALAADLAPLLRTFRLDPRLERELDAVEERRRRDWCEAIRQLIERRPDFFARFDYAWTTDPTVYVQSDEAWLQYEALIVLSQIDPEHPALRSHRPVVVKVLRTVDFASTSVRGERCDYVLMSQPHFVLLRELAVLLRGLRDAWSERGHPPPAVVDEPWLDSWAADAIEELAAADPAVLGRLFTPLQRQAVHLAQGEIPPDPPPLREWIDAGIAARDPLAFEVQITYMAIDRFILFHELGHLLEGHLNDTPRSLSVEADADRAAISLMISRLGGAVSDPPPGLPPPTLDELVFGPATYLHLLRALLLFIGAYRSAAVLSDAAFAPGDRVLQSTRSGVEELDARLAGIFFAAVGFELADLRERMLRRVLKFHALYRGACVTLLSQLDVAVEAQALPAFDFNAAIERLAEGIRSQAGGG